MSDIPMSDAPVSGAPSNAGKRKRSTSPPVPPAKKPKTNEELENAVRSKDILRSMGVGQEYVSLLGRPLDDLTPTEKSRLQEIRLDKWLIAGANEISDEVLTFWLAHQDPMYISHQATAVLPPWVLKDKTWYRLWWKYSPFTMPGEHCRMGRSPEEQIAEHWVLNTFQPNRVGKPKHVVCELLITWQMSPNTPMTMDRTNLFGLLWLFDRLGGDMKKLQVKFRFKDRVTGTALKRNFPPAMKGYEDKLMGVLNRCLTEYKKHLDGVKGYSYVRYMSPVSAMLPGNRDRLVRMWHIHAFGRELDLLWFYDRVSVGFFKVSMLKAFGRTWPEPEDSTMRDMDVHAWLRTKTP